MAHRLDTAARRNQVKRESDLHSALEGDESGVLAEFATFVARSTFSTNVAADKIIAFDESDKILDARRLRVHQAGGNRAAGLRAFAASAWSARRDAFEARWQHGRRFVYGAVNGGNMGTEGFFGGFCIVVNDPRTAEPRALAVFPADTAQTYTDEQGRLDAAATSAAATRWEDRTALAVRERADEAMASPRHEWADVLCRPNHYLEVVIAPLALGSVDEVRLRASDLERLEELELEDLAKAPLENSERMELDALLCMRRWQGGRGIAMRAY
jgi:hypothetical protein